MSTSKIYPAVIERWATLAPAAVRIALHTSSYTFSPLHKTRADVYAEVTGVGYSAGGKSAALTAYFNSGSARTVLSIPTTEWDYATITARYAIVYYYPSSTLADQTLIALVDFGSDISCAAGGTLRVDASAGLITLA